MVWECEEVEMEEGRGGEDVSVCHGLDWKRVLGLHLWYCSSPTCRVAEAVAQFTRAFLVSCAAYTVTLDLNTFPPLYLPLPHLSLAPSLSLSLLPPPG